MDIIVFEDSLYDNFYPLSLTRPVWELLSGCFTFRERLEKTLAVLNGTGGCKVHYLTRDYIAPYYRERLPGVSINDGSIRNISGDVLLINALLLPSEKILKCEKNRLYLHENIPLFARFESGIPSHGGEDDRDISAFLKRLNLDEENIGLEHLPVSIWDIVLKNHDRIVSDYALLDKKTSKSKDYSVTITGDENQLYIEDGVGIDPLVCIDLTEGPVVIGGGTRIDSFTRIEGPCFIGRNCRLLGAKIRGGSTIGDFCRIGGEVEGSIFQGYSNKYHDGFIGHSFVGEWVNLGAMTTNSDLKNDYSEVKVYLPDRRRATGSIKAGCFIGDYAKTSIGTLISTGSSIGTGCMIVHGGSMTPPHVPPFAWFIDNGIRCRDWVPSFLRTCGIIASRRGVQFSGNCSKMLEHVYSATDEARKRESVKWKEMRR
jgi:UDP-N-acetylglucosamine diphosphorylase/glucosamine-1-phosphate N-acetyltransferase